MNDTTEKLKSARRKKLITWAVRQVITGCIVVPVVMTWPGWKWLYVAWAVLATASLALNLYLFRKIEAKLDELGADTPAPEAPDADPDGKQAEAWDAHKSSLMTSILGPEHDMVMHAIIPFAIGGGLDLYYFPNGVTGTAIATKELSALPDQGPESRDFSCYELVMFTRHALDMDKAKERDVPFGRAHSTINSILNCIARYSSTATLNPNETCEFPAEMESIGGKCLIFSAYGARSDDIVRNFGLLAVIEIHRSEMDYAREHGGATLLEKLRTAGHYPYSDMDRNPVV